MVDMIATKKLKYGTRRLTAGDPFEARHDRDARLLIGIGKARRAEKAEPAKDELAELRAEYQEVVGKRPFYGWDAVTLREKIAEA